MNAGESFSHVIELSSGFHLPPQAASRFSTPSAVIASGSTGVNRLLLKVKCAVKSSGPGGIVPGGDGAGGSSETRVKGSDRVSPGAPEISPAVAIARVIVVEQNPVPKSVTVAGYPGPLNPKRIVPLLLPATTGANRRFIECDSPTARVKGASPERIKNDSISGPF